MDKEQQIRTSQSFLARHHARPILFLRMSGIGTPSEVAMHVTEIIKTGVVGINLEDGFDGSIRSIGDAAARLQAARETAKKEGVPIVINARCDIFHLKDYEEKMRLPATLERCKAYLAAGADCVYPFGLRDLAIIAALTEGLDAPVNITGRPGMPSLTELERMGVARVTIASAHTGDNVCHPKTRGRTSCHRRF